MASLANRTSGDAGSEVFASLWAALQNSYDGINLTKTVARLLHLYQPEDGILAYERLLRTLYILLEHFDTNGFRLLVSMVQPPKDVPESVIQEVFQKATGFARITHPVSQTNLIDSSEQLNSNVDITTEITDPNHEDVIDCSEPFATNEEEVSEKLNASFQTTSPSPDEFRGFPSIEINNTQVRVQNINQFYKPKPVNCESQSYLQSYQNCNHNVSPPTTKIDNQHENEILTSPSTENKIKVISTPYLLKKNAIHQASEPSYTIQECSKNSRKLAVIDLTQKEHDYNKESKSKQSVPVEKVSLGKKVKFSDSFSDVKEKRKLCYEAKSTEKREWSDEEITLLEDDVIKIQRAIQEDIYKMDVVQPPEIYLCNSNDSANAKVKILEPEDLVVHDELRQSIQNFLQRARTEEVVSTPTVSKTKSTSQKNQKTVSDKNSAFIDSWKKIITKSVLSRDLKSNPSNPENKSALPNNKTNASKNSSTAKKGTQKKVRRKKSNPPAKKKSGTVTRKSLNRAQINETEHQSFTSKASIKSTSHLSTNKGTIPEEFNLSDGTQSCKLNSFNKLEQRSSANELVNYKKHYYDALLSIQRAKVAVANSLAISSVTSGTGYNPYYYNYLHQQHQLMQNQQQFLLGTQFSSQNSLQLSNNQSGSSSWENCSGWRYPSFRHCQFPQTSYAVYPSTVETSNVNFLAQNTVAGDVRNHEDNQCDQLRPNTKRKNLEDIVGKLKQTENIDINQNPSIN